MEISIHLLSIDNYKLKNKTLEEVKRNMEIEVLEIYKNFKKDFKYNSYITSYKCKIDCENDSRECIIEKDNNIISVNCGKIIGIFELEEYLREKINIQYINK